MKGEVIGGCGNASGKVDDGLNEIVTVEAMKFFWLLYRF
jgi:hypothetical protein